MKKIYDILPPKGASEKQKAFLPIGLEKKEAMGPSRRSLLRKPGLSGRAFAVGAAILLAGVLAAGAYVKFLEVRITVWPTQEEWEFKEKMTVAARASGLDVAAKIIPGRAIEDTYEAFQQFQSSGTADKETKATGVIRVYNKYNLPQVLVVNTRFLSSEGKLFRSTGRVSISSGQYADVAVEAAEPGEGDNIDKAAFSIPGLAGSPRYTSVYGESLASMTGGAGSKADRATEEDIRKAKDSINETLLSEGRGRIASLVGGDMIFLDRAFSQEVVGIESLVSAGAEVQYFQVKGTVNSRALVFKKEDLNSFIRDFIAGQAGQGKLLNEESLKLEITLKEVSWEEENMMLEVSFSVKLYPDLNLKELQSQLAGKTPQEANSILDNHSAIANFEMKFWPLPIRKIPEDADKIKLILRL